MPVSHLKIGGMSCQGCANRIEKALRRHGAVRHAEVSFAAETARVEHDADIGAAELALWVSGMGFRARVLSSDVPESGEAKPLAPDWRLKLLLALTATFVPGMAGMVFGSHALMPPLWWQVAAATVVQLYLAQPFYRRAWAALRAKSANMDVLVALGTVAAYGYSLAMMRHGAHAVYFETGVMVIAFVSLGKYWEARLKRHSLNGLALLFKLMPQQARVWRDGAWTDVPAGEVALGEKLLGVHGGRVAADGTVLSGEAWADESHLTGEAAPVPKAAGDTVLAGSVLHGSVAYRADKLGSETLLGDMMRALAQAQAEKAPAAALADRVAAVFVPMVGAAAVLAFVANVAAGTGSGTALVRAVAVLVAACPCALGLATPAAVMAGMAAAVRHGVWFKTPAALEAAADADTAAFDKTGTLTEGRPDIVAVWTAPHFDAETVLRAAAALERHSLHPFAAAIVRRAEAGQPALPAVSDPHTEAGQGIAGVVDGIGTVRTGSPAFCGLDTADLPDEAVWRDQSIAAVAVNGKAAGAFAFADALKPDSAAAIKRLKQMGMEVCILSGDRSEAVARTAAALGISQAWGGLSPRGKTEIIARLNAQGKHVAMFGDGINDAPALAAAAIGFAPYGSSAAAEHSAQAVLTRPSVAQAADAFALARATRRTIRQNLFFAFAYNTMAIPMAACGAFSPTVAGMAMACSSVSVLLNALRLKNRWFGKQI